MNSILFTSEGYNNLYIQKKELLEKRQETVEHLKKAREMGDLSENGYYKAAKFELGQIDRNLRKLEELIRFGKVIPKSQSNTVEIESTVVINDGTTTREFLIVGEYESNPLENKLSHNSPLGKALIGKKAGDKITFITPSGENTYSIVEIK